METVPSRDEFVRLAEHQSVVPVSVEVLGDRSTPVGLFETLVGDGPGFLLESVEGGERWGRWSFVGWDPLFVVESAADGATTTDGPFDIDGSDPLQALEQVLASCDAPTFDDFPPLHSGLVGFLAYDVVRYVERLESPPVDDRGLPQMVWHAVGSLAAFDHLRQRVRLVRNVAIGDDPGAGYDDAVEHLRRAMEQLAAAPGSPVVPVPPAELGPSAPAETSMTREEFEAVVVRLQAHIAAGDAFQVVPSIRFAVDDVNDHFAVYRALRVLNPSPYMFFFRHGDVSLAGSSPELMVRVRDGVVSSRPIAGTRPRGADAEADQVAEADLRADPKEAAEHVMLVDLARNDVGRVSTFGSVTVDDLMVVERYSHVMHLVSAVSGQLREGVGPVDVVRATFPHGTVSGAPKVRAMELIDELEPVRRGPYAGAVGYVDFSGNLDTAIALRTMVAKGGTAWVQAGAGVVADSVPALEYEECRAKAAAVLAAIAWASHV